jgi:NAD(P)-dependent dehydrogenase (short-subunit alcohol dehydrogenase family)
VNYGAAKAGIAALTVIADLEMATFGVRVNAIAPGARTRMTERLFSFMSADDGTFDEYDPANVSPLAAYLATADAPEHGRVYFVRGGYIGVFQPWHVVKRLDKAQRWSIDELAERMPELDVELAATY